MSAHTLDSDKDRSLAEAGLNPDDDISHKPKWYRIGVNSWSQITLVSIVCFFLPGMYNAISGMGGSGQLDPTVSPPFALPNRMPILTLLGRRQRVRRAPLGRRSNWSSCRPAHV